MKKTIITILLTVVVLVVAAIGVKVFLFSGNDDAKDPGTVDTTNIPITTDQQPSAVDPVQSDPNEIPAVTPTVPSADDPVKLLDIGTATFKYDSTKLVFDEIPPAEENGTPMVSFMSIEGDETLPRVDAIPLKVSITGEGEDNFMNITEESWQKLAAASVIQYLSPMSQEKAQISFSGTVVKKESDSSMKMFTNVSISIPNEVATQTGDMSMNGSIRLVSNSENAVITMAMCRQSSSLPEAMKDAYMSLEVRA